MSRSIPDEQNIKNLIVDATNTCATMREAAQLLNMPFNTFVYRAKKFGVYNPNQGGVGSKAKTAAILKSTTPLAEILDGLHPSFRTGRLKEKLLNEGIFENKCSKCGVGDSWQDEHLVLELDHINGISDDHRLKNLRILCPNCHSQTPTFRGRK